VTTIFKAIVGSKLHGYATEESDTDYVTVYSEPLRRVISLYGDAPKGNQQHGENDSTVYELRHFCRLLVKGNPTVFDAVFSSLREETSKYDTMLRTNLDKFIDTANVYHATCGYVQSTTREARESRFDNVRRGKKALAALRVIRQGQELLLNGTYDPSVQVNKTFALELKNGEERAIGQALSLIEFEERTLGIAHFNVEHKKSDIAWINDFLYYVYSTQPLAPPTIKAMPKAKMLFIGGSQ
jgi:predicted nucleotidyltransferase